MGFKIEINILGITNYPDRAKHFEAMAAKGWLIDKCVLENWFIYKKIKPEELDFSITPYEVEESFNKKSKAELEEFRGVCKQVGWNYATKSRDFHIYFKEAGAVATDLETDPEEELNTLEKIGSKEIAASVITIPIFALLLFAIYKLGFDKLELMKSMLGQIFAVVGPVFLVLTIVKTYKMQQFLKKNKENIELGQEIKYSASKDKVEKVTMFFLLILIILVSGEVIYRAAVLKDISIFSFLIPYVTVMSIIWFYRLVIKPSKKSYDFKVISSYIAVIVALILAFVLSYRFMGDFEGKTEPDLAGLKVIKAADLNEEDSDMTSELKKDFSLLIPESYEYTHFTKESYISTEYTRSLNEEIAKYVVKEYVKRAQTNHPLHYKEDLKYAIEKNDYKANFERDAQTPEDMIEEVDLEEYGLTQEEFDKLDKKNPKLALEEAMEIMEGKSITEDNKDLWKADEVYFLSNNKEKIVIRQGKEVFMLEGLDFSDPQVIQIVKEKLEL